MEEFIEALPVADRASLRARIDFLAEVGNRAREPLSKSLADPLKKTHMQRCAQSSRYNVRAVYASARRYIARLASEIFLSGLQNDVDKKSQKTPRREMQLALKRMEEV